MRVTFFYRVLFSCRKAALQCAHLAISGHLWLSAGDVALLDLLLDSGDVSMNSARAGAYGLQLRHVTRQGVCLPHRHGHLIHNEQDSRAAQEQAKRLTARFADA